MELQPAVADTGRLQQQGQDTPQGWGLDDLRRVLSILSDAAQEAPNCIVTSESFVFPGKEVLFSLLDVVHVYKKSWTLGKGPPAEGVVSHWKGLTGKWSRHQAWQSSRSVWMTLSRAA